MEDHNKKYIPSDSADQPSTSKPESGVSEEDARRIVEWVDRNYQRNNVWEFAYKQAELVEEIERLKDRINTYLDAVHSIAHKRIDLQDVVDAIRGVSNQTEEIDRQAAELSKLRQENEAKRSDLTDKLEEAVRHMDNGHTAQATTLIYEVIGELEPKGE